MTANPAPMRVSPSLANLPRATIAYRRDLTEDLMVMKLRTPEPFGFKAGQYITIGVENVERPYSIVSAPYEPEVELFIELVPRGELTPLLWRLKVGDTVSYRPRAKGLFTLDRKATQHVMVGTVTGVVPYVSILRQYLHDTGTGGPLGTGTNGPLGTGTNGPLGTGTNGPLGNDSGHRFYVLLGGSFVKELGYRDELSRLAKTHPDFIQFVPTVSRPADSRNEGWTGQTGRVNNILEEYLGRFGVSKAETLIYACGHPQMIEDVKARFIPQGWRVKEERFWKEEGTPPPAPPAAIWTDIGVP